MGHTWYRGESTALGPAKPGGDLHDFGDGLYLTDTKAIAERYAQMRVSTGGGQERILEVSINRGELGRVLDLTADPRWAQFLRTPSIPGNLQTTPERLIRLANENYGRCFEAFLAQNRIRIQDFNAVIGPEFVRGGKQLAILHRNGAPSSFAVQIRARLQPIGGGPPAGLPTLVPPATGLRGVVSNQAAMAVVGQLLGAALQAIGDYGIQRRVRQELEGQAAAVANILGRGEGVLVIVALQEWETEDFNGNRVRNFLDLYLEGGPDQATAMRRWQGTPRYLKNAPPGWRVKTQYSWIPPQPAK